VGGFDIVGQWGIDLDRRHTINTHHDRRCD
jgi:hypothetical protein